MSTEGRKRCSYEQNRAGPVLFRRESKEHPHFRQFDAACVRGGSGSVEESGRGLGVRPKYSKRLCLSAAFLMEKDSDLPEKYGFVESK